MKKQETYLTKRLHGIVMFFVVLLVDEGYFSERAYAQCFDFMEMVSVHSGAPKTNVVTLFLGQKLSHLRLSLVRQASLN